MPSSPLARKSPLISLFHWVNRKFKGVNTTNIVGVIHEKDFYAARYQGETMVSNIKSPVFYTTGNTKAFELLRILQKNKAHMAVVVDEYGGTQGPQHEPGSPAPGGAPPG